MKYVCLIYHEETKLAALPQAEAAALRASYIAFTTSIVEGGQHIVGEALQPTHTATTVRVRRGKLTTTDGPVADMREQLGGFYLIEARNHDEAMQIAARIPGALTGAVELRPVVNFS